MSSPNYSDIDLNDHRKNPLTIKNSKFKPELQSQTSQNTKQAYKNQKIYYEVGDKHSEAEKSAHRSDNLGEFELVEYVIETPK